MQRLKELLDSVLGQTTFDLGTGESVSPVQLRGIFDRNLWAAEDSLRARKAQPVISDGSLPQLSSHLRLFLKDYVDSKRDSIGLALPAGPSFRKLNAQKNGLYSIEWVSTVEDLAKALTKGAAVLGTERVAELFSSWLKGEPVKYKTTAMINALDVRGSFSLTNGIRLEPLPLATDSLPANLPRRQDMPAKEYLGRPILSIESTASPPLFRPSTDPMRQNVQAFSEPDVDVAIVCEALSLESNSFVDAAFYWNDYEELWAFSLSDENLCWSSGNARVRGRPKPTGSRTSSHTGVTTLLPKGERLTLNSTDSQFYLTLKALESSNSKKIRVAITRWIMSKDFEKNQVDKFIDLRIALESLYLHNIGNEKYRGEMRLRLSLFGAWHLGTNFEERREIQKNLKRAYDEASRAVHGGEFDDDTTEIQKLLSDAQDLCRRGILKLLMEGPPPDWGDLILGVEDKASSVEQGGNP